jgi:hypothetical protein
MDTILFGKWKLFGLRLSFSSVLVVVGTASIILINGNPQSVMATKEQGSQIVFTLSESDTAWVSTPSSATLQMKGTTPDDVMDSPVTIGVPFIPHGYTTEEILDKWNNESTLYYLSEVYPISVMGAGLSGSDRDVSYRIQGDEQTSVTISKRLSLKQRVSIYVLDGILIVFSIFFVSVEHMRLSRTTL